MDDRYREGFERLLSDMDEPPSWEQISTQYATPTPVPTRGRGLLVAAAAFAVTVVAVGAVILALPGDSEPTAGPVGATVDYVEISWTQDVELLCVDMEKVDNGGFGLAKVEIWGPNADGLIRVDATAPDGTVERVITAHPRGYGDGWQVWSSYEDELGEEETVFRVAGCTDGLPNGASHFRVSEAPVTAHGHLFGAFVSIPVERPNGSPIDLLAGLPLNLTVRDDAWRGVPVKVVESANAGTASMGAFANNLEVWVDPVRRRYEQLHSVGSDEVLGTVVTTTEVIRRGTVPADSVSFSVEDLTLTLDILSADSPWTDQQLSDAAITWVNQIGLNQSDPDVWRSRLDRICDIGPTTVDADTAMSRLAGEFIAEDAGLSVRADGELPTSAEAVDSLWTIAISPACLETSLTGTTDNTDLPPGGPFEVTVLPAGFSEDKSYASSPDRPPIPGGTSGTLQRWAFIRGDNADDTEWGIIKVRVISGPFVAEDWLAAYQDTSDEETDDRGHRYAATSVAGISNALIEIPINVHDGLTVLRFGVGEYQIMITGSGYVAEADLRLVANGIIHR